MIVLSGSTTKLKISNKINTKVVKIHLLNRALHTGCRKMKNSNHETMYSVTTFTLILIIVKVCFAQCIGIAFTNNSDLLFFNF